MTKHIRSLVFATGLVLVSAPWCRAETGAELYAAKCKKCHAEDGSGKTKMGEKFKMKPLDQSQSDDQWFEISKNGKDKMPKFDGKLTDEQLKEIITHMRTLK